MSTNLIIAVVILAIVAYGVFTLLKKKSNKTGSTRALAPSPAPPPKGDSGDDDQDHTEPKPNPGKSPADPKQPPPPPASPAVLIDRNGKRPGDAGYDPRIDAPPDRFSPPEPFGAFYGEGAFDPDSRWRGPDGPHWTDKHGVHHGPQG